MDKVRIGDVCSVVSGSTPKSNIEEYWNGDIKWITPAEISNDSYVISDTERHITEKAVKKTNLTLLPVGTVLLSSRAPIGKTAIVGAEMYCNQGFKNLICSERIYNKYLYFFLTSKVDYLNTLGRGATFKEISKGIVEEVEIPLPSLDEQKNIAERFEVIQQLINQRNQALSNLDNLVKSRFVEMFGDPVGNTHGWEKTRLADKCDIVTGNTPSRKVKEYYGSNIEWIKSDNITDAKTLTTATEYLSEKGEEVGRTVEAGSILMTCIAGSLRSIGNVAIADRKVAFNQQINAIIPNEQNTHFMYEQFRLSKDYICSGVNMALKGILSKGQLSEIEFVFPPIDLQKQFADFAAQADKSKLAVQQSIETLQTLKAKLMQDYFG